MESLLHPSAYIRAERVGVGVRVGPLAVIEDGVVLEDGCVLGAAVCVGAGARVGAGAVLQPGVVIAAGVEIGAGARVEAGATVARRVPPHAVVQAPAARIAGYADTPARPAPDGDTAPGSTESAVAGVRLHVLRSVQDLRGDLCAAEVGADIPFVVRRSFVVYNVPSAELRGEHAHRACAQFLIAVHGSVHVIADDGVRREEFVLDRPGLGLYLPPMVWGTQYRYSADGVLLVLASAPYDAADYIRDYAEFLQLVRQHRGTAP